MTGESPPASKYFWVIGGLSVILVLVTLAVLWVSASGMVRGGEEREISLVVRGMALRREGAPEPTPLLTFGVNERIALVVVNDDPGQDHELSIPALQIKTRLIPYGQQERILLTVREAGEFRYYCALHPDAMTGILRVETQSPPP